MSGFDSLLSRLREVYASVAEIETAARAAPSDPYVMANLDSVKHFASQLEAQWEEACRDKQLEVCRYRLVAENTDRYTIQSFTKSLLDFQELFTQVYDALTNGPKKCARISSEIAQKTAFEFGFSYPGSLGVAIFTHGERNLFGSDYDSTVDALFQLTSVKDEFEVRDLAKTLGEAVVKKVYDWSLVNVDAGYGVDINWTTSGGKRGEMIGQEKLGKLVGIISSTSDVERETFKAYGSLVGMDVSSERFRFVVRDGPDYAGTLAEAMPKARQWSINKNYLAEIEVETITHYATLEARRTYRLMALEDDQTA